MARHKTIQTEEQEDPEMNISSMIDCCFLLLIYFLVATSLVSEKKIDMTLPANSSSSPSSSPPPEPGNITIDASGQVQWGTGESLMPIGAPFDPSLTPGTPGYRDQRDMSDLVNELQTLSANAGETGPVIYLQANAATYHQRVIDVMSALAKAGIQRVNLKPAVED